jgi:transposase-like protein
MTGSNAKSEVLRGPERRRRWAASEKFAMVAETHEPGVTVSLVARRQGVAPNQLFAWRRRGADGGGIGGRGRSSLRLSRFAEPAARDAAASGQEDHGGGDSQGGA